MVNILNLGLTPMVAKGLYLKESFAFLGDGISGGIRDSRNHLPPGLSI